MDCIFCQIVAGKIPSEIIYQDEELIAFRDINPQAPTHLLIIPRKHIPSLDQLSQTELPLMGRMVTVANKLAKDEVFTNFVWDSLMRHSRGDWGDICMEDWQENEVSLQEGYRLLSSYSKMDNGRVKYDIWIITEADRSVTTILFPEEY